MQILTPLWSTAAAHHTIAPSLLVSLSTLAAKSYHVTKEGQVNLKNSYNKIARTKKARYHKKSLLPPERHGPVRLRRRRRFDAFADARPGVRDFGVAPPPPRKPHAAGQGARAQT